MNVCTHRHCEADRQFYAAFTEETGIAVNVVEAGADELIQRLASEGENSPADLLVAVDAGRLHRAKEMDLLQPVDSSRLDRLVPERLRDPEGSWYALTRSAYSRTLVPLLESAESLGSSRNLFFTFALPLARPAIVAGAGLVLMEVLNEYGTMVYLGHSTLTTGVFQAWFLHGDLAAARSLAPGIFILILLLQKGEARLRGGSRFAPVETGSRYRRRKLSPGRRIMAASFLWVLVTVGFAVPVGGIVVLVLRGAGSSATFWSYFQGAAESGTTTALLAIGATAIALALALCLAYARRLCSWMSRLTTWIRHPNDGSWTM